MSDTYYVSAENLLHDDFGVQFTKQEGEFVYDAKTKMGPWATMSFASFQKYGIGKLGVGYGQKYKRTKEGRLLLIEGGSNFE